MDEIAQVVGAEGLRKNRRRTRSGLSRQSATRDARRRMPPRSALSATALAAVGGILPVTKNLLRPVRAPIMVGRR